MTDAEFDETVIRSYRLSTVFRMPGNTRIGQACDKLDCQRPPMMRIAELLTGSPVRLKEADMPQITGLVVVPIARTNNHNYTLGQPAIYGPTAYWHMYAHYTVADLYQLGKGCGNVLRLWPSEVRRPSQAECRAVLQGLRDMSLPDCELIRYELAARKDLDVDPAPPGTDMSIDAIAARAVAFTRRELCPRTVDVDLSELRCILDTAPADYRSAARELCAAILDLPDLDDPPAPRLKPGMLVVNVRDSGCWHEHIWLVVRVRDGVRLIDSAGETRYLASAAVAPFRAATVEEAEAFYRTAVFFNQAAV